jgi:hypothetical protein
VVATLICAVDFGELRTVEMITQWVLAHAFVDASKTARTKAARCMTDLLGLPRKQRACRQANARSPVGRVAGV